MRPTRDDLFDGLEHEGRLRVRERRQLLRSHRRRTRPLLLTWWIDLCIMAGLYVLGYGGACAYWSTLRGLWDEQYLVLFSALGHAIPALVAGVYVGILYSRGRFFFVIGPLVLVGATFVREVWLPWGGADSLGLPWWLYWAACAEALISGGLAMWLGAWAGARVRD